MVNQLAENSVRIYRLAPEGFAAARNRFLRQKAVLLACIILFVVALIYKQFGQTRQLDPIECLLVALFVATIIFVAAGIGLRKGIKRNRESWNSFELVVGEDFLIRRIKDFPELEIQRNEVTKIRENPTGIYVETKRKDRTIAIARALTDYQDAKQRLSHWMPTEERREGWAARWTWLYTVTTVALFAVFLMTTTNWVVVATGLPLFIGLSLSIWLIRRSVNVSAYQKRLSLLTVLPLLAIITRLFQAIQNLR